MSETTPRRETSDPTESEILDALARILASPDFASAPQLSRFLNHIVKETISGRGAQIKGFTIATEALGRGSDFDPQADPIVRVEARRLRSALSRYYDRVDITDPVVLDLPKGGYVPGFRYRQPPVVVAGSPPQAPPAMTVGSPRHRLRRIGMAFRSRWRAGLSAVAVVAAIGWWLAVPPSHHPVPPAPTPAATPVAAASPAAPRPTTPLPDLHLIRVAVVPESLDEASYSVVRSSAADLAAALSLFDELRVDLVTVADPANFDFTLHFRMSYRDGAHDLALRIDEDLPGRGVRPIWARWHRANAEDLRIEGADSVLRAFAAELADVHGVLLAAVRDAANPTAWEGRAPACIARAALYWLNYDREDLAAARECLQLILDGEDTNSRSPAAVSAHLAMLYLEEHRLAPIGKGLQRGYLRSAYLTALDAVRKSPAGARAHQALADVLFVWRDTAGGLAAMERARQLNPLSADIAADLGARLVAMGRITEGRKLVEEAESKTGGRPSWYDFFLSKAYFLEENIPDFLRTAERLRATSYQLGLVLQVIAASYTDRHELARKLMGRLIEIDSSWSTDPISAIERYGFDPAIVQRISNALTVYIDNR